jgi:putative DNA primase/helicase
MNDPDSDVDAKARAKYGRVEPEGPDPFGPNGTEPSQQEKVFAERLAQFQSALCSFEDFCKLDVKPREHLIGDWMLEGDTGFVFGQRGSGKTWLLDLIVSRVSSGRSIDDEWDITSKEHVLLVDGEMPLDDSRARLKGLGADGEYLHVLHHEVLFEKTGLVMNLTDPTIQQIITKLCEDTGAKLLVLDTQSSLFRGMSEAEADDWEKVLGWLLDLRRRRIATLIVLHAGWNGEHARGTSRREDDAFWVIKVKQTDEYEPNEKGCKFETIFTKCRNTDARPKARRWHIVTEHDGTVTYNCDDFSFDDKVFDLIQAGEPSPTEIAKELSVSRSTVIRAIRRLEKQKRIKRVGSGKNVTYEPCDGA